MVRGCQKRIIYLKNTGSDVFDEAYFVIKDDRLQGEKSECDMVEEANRILNEAFDFEDKGGLGGRILTHLKSNAIGFALGFILGALIFALLM